MTGYFSPFPLLTADVISHPPRTRSRSNLKLLWTAVLKPRNQMKTFITRTLTQATHTYTHTDRQTEGLQQVLTVYPLRPAHPSMEGASQIRIAA